MTRDAAQLTAGQACVDLGWDRSCGDPVWHEYATAAIQCAEDAALAVFWRDVLLTEVVNGPAMYAGLTGPWAAVVGKVHPRDGIRSTGWR